MFGLGTIINTVAIFLGGICGLLFGKFLNEQLQDSLNMACGVSVLFIGISGAMEGMLSISEAHIVSAHSMMVVLSLTIGTLIGQLLDIEGKFEKFGEWLKIRSGNAKDKKFVDGFVSASFTVCIGAMAIVGALEDGISHDYTILATKSILDFIIIIVFTCSYGKGPMFSMIPVFIFQGGVTLLSTFIEPLMSELALSYLSLVGSVLIFCVGLNIVWGKKVKVANLLPAILIAVLFSYLPISL